MPRRKHQSIKGEEFLNHYGAVRLRVQGVGNLKLTLRSLSNIYSSVLAPLAMNSATNIEPTVLSNFTQQRSQLEITITELDETFQISQITVFTRPVASSIPQ